MWDRILDKLMRDFVQRGALAITYPDGTQRRYGEPDATEIAITLHDPTLPRRIALNADLAVGEAYMDARLTIDGDDLEGFLILATVNAAAAGRLWWWRASKRWQATRRTFDQWNPAHRARENVAHHYDLSPELYDLFLDRARQYSCAYFADPDMTLDQAQAAKIHHIAGKLRLEPGMRVLEIGCGWGGLAMTLARDYKVHVTGVTLSEEQHSYALAQARVAGLSDRTDFRLQDYRDVPGQFDRIVSVGMFEHVGVPHYRAYFDTVRERLTQDGIALIHTIGRVNPPGSTSPWIRKYIFPGGYCPALSEVAAAIQTTGLYPCDIEIWRLHYAETLRHWYDRFMAQQDRARALYDDRFCRMWRYYLKAAEATFRHHHQAVFQLQLARRQEAVPLTRDYLYREPIRDRVAAE